MQNKLFAIKLNFLVGEFLWKERHHSGVERAEVEVHCGVNEVQLRAYEKGLAAVPVNLLCKLAALYKVERTELNYFLEKISIKAQRPWKAHEYAKMVLHRQKVI